MQVHETSQPITRRKAWQPRAGNAVDRFWDWLSCQCTGCRMANHIGKKHSNYIQIEAIHPQSYRQLVHEGQKIPGRYNSSWNTAPFFLKSSGPLNCTFTRISITNKWQIEKVSGMEVVCKSWYFDNDSIRSPWYMTPSVWPRRIRDNGNVAIVIGLTPIQCYPISITEVRERIGDWRSELESPVIMRLRSGWAITHACDTSLWVKITGHRLRQL